MQKILDPCKNTGLSIDKQEENNLSSNGFSNWQKMKESKKLIK